MRKKVLSVLLCTAMAATMLTGCGGKDDAGSSTNKGSSSEAGSTSTATLSDDGKVLNIRCWNEEFKTRLEDYYPDYEKVDKTHGKIGDVDVVWNITPSDDNAYQNALDEALLAQESASADDKIDMFLVEADYALKYVNGDYTVDIVNDLVKYGADFHREPDGSLSYTKEGAHSHHRIIFHEENAVEHIVEIRMAAGDEEKKFTILGFGYVL